MTLAQNRRRALIQMATGSGKTFTAVDFVYRLITHAGARRVLFLVDRGNLGDQTLKEFQQFVTPPDDGRKFNELYNLQHLQSRHLVRSAACASPPSNIGAAFLELREALATELLDQLAKIDPFRFERAVLDLLVAMGYGGSRAEAAEVTRKTNDEGIDGVINEDRLGLDAIYIQAKRWKGNVGRQEIQNFVGALAGKKANKGIFITTSDFNANAPEYAGGLHQKVILIGGRRLAELMIDHNVGVAVERVYEVKRVDSDYLSDAG